MNSKLITLYKIVIDGVEIYKASENVPLGATPLAHYTHINDLYMPGEQSVGTYSTSISNSTQYVTKTLSDESRQRISESSKRQAGTGNSQFGTRWIHSLKKKKSKKIRATDELPAGWLEGRKIKFVDVEGEVREDNLDHLKTLFENKKD